MVNVPELVLDPSLKYWVLLPISFVMVIVGILRTNITMLVQPTPKLTGWRALREQQQIGRAKNFRMNANIFIDREEFESRQSHLSETLNSLKYLKDPIKKQADGPVNPFGDPSTNDFLFAMFKNNVMNYIPQTLIMWWVNFFFSGFVVMKLPFPLTIRFKSMLQTGIQTPDLNVRWVSSISWYFVNLLGLKSVYSLILQDSSMVDQLMQQQQQGQQMMMPPGGLSGGPTPDKIMKNEAENIDILEFRCCLDGIERRYLNHCNIKV